MHAAAAAKTVFPAQTLFFNAGTFGFRADVFARISRAVRFAKGVATGGQCNGFFIVHRHAGEGFANIARRCERVRIAVRAFWIDVNQTHLHRGQRIFQCAVAAVARVVQHFAFWAPVDVFFWFPNIRAAAAEAEGFETHRIHRDIAGQHQ